MKGKLYGVGVGPGDPELLTLKAVRMIKEADVIAVPGNTPQESIAYKISKAACPEIAITNLTSVSKELLAVPMPMIKEKKELNKAHDQAAELIKSKLDEGKNVVFLTLGDPTVYSTYLYVHKRISDTGYETEIVSGITSFCAVSAKLNTGLVENHEPLHIIPASYQIDDAMKLQGTKVFMKAGKKIGDVKKKIKKSGMEAMMIENCGMPDEHIYTSVDEIPEDAGYYSLVIVKEVKGL